MSKEQVQAQAKEAADEMGSAMSDLEQIQDREAKLAERMKAKAQREMANGHVEKAKAELISSQALSSTMQEVNEHLANIKGTMGLAKAASEGFGMPGMGVMDEQPALPPLPPLEEKRETPAPAKDTTGQDALVASMTNNLDSLGLSLLQLQAPEDELAKEMTHDLEMNFNKIAPFGKEDTAKELQDHAA